MLEQESLGALQGNNALLYTIRTGCLLCDMTLGLDCSECEMDSTVAASISLAGLIGALASNWDSK